MKSYAVQYEGVRVRFTLESSATLAWTEPHGKGTEFLTSGEAEEAARMAFTEAQSEKWEVVAVIEEAEVRP
jgi:hypothetical protein